jgi:hypothetical protein
MAQIMNVVDPDVIVLGVSLSSESTSGEYAVNRRQFVKMAASAPLLPQ